MSFHKSTADIYVPSGGDLESALARTTHLGVGAHQDDLEIMAYAGVIQCFQKTDQWFSGVTCTNGAGSARIGVYENFSDEDMVNVRREEQRRAALMGDFSAVVQLDYTSTEVKDPAHTDLTEDLVTILSQAQPETVYTHNPADKHPTHIGVIIPTINALRELNADQRPKHVYGCEVWRNLDWLADNDKVVLDTSPHPNLANALVGIFDSQIAGGKRYDLATTGRWCANATYYDSHSVDSTDMMAFAMDLSPLIHDPTTDIVDYVLAFIDDFRSNVEDNLRSRIG